jgi:hypothetical protein
MIHLRYEMLAATAILRHNHPVETDHADVDLGDLS